MLTAADAAALSMRRAAWARRDAAVRGGLLAALVAVVPLFRFAFAQDQHILPKIVLGGVLIALAGAWWGWGLAAGRPFRLTLTPVTWGVLLFFGAHVLGWLMALREGSSFPLATSRLTWLAAVFLFFLLFQDFARGRRKFLVALGWMIVASAFVSAVWVLIEDVARWRGAAGAARVVSRLEDWRGHLAAGLGNTGFVADWCALSFPPAVMLLLRVRRRWQVAALVLHLTLAAAAMIVCWSVHSNAGLILAAVFMVTYLLTRRRRLLARRLPRIGAVVALWVAVVAFFVIPHPLNPHPQGIVREAFGSQRWEDGLGTRLVIWSGALAAIQQRPLVGWGTGNFTYAYAQTPNTLIASDSLLAPFVGEWTNAAHNSLLQVFAELGIPGLVALLFLVFAFFGAMRRSLGRGALVNDDIRLVATAQGIAGVTHSMMNFPLQLPSFLLFYAALAAVPVVLVGRSRALREQTMDFEFEFPGVSLSLEGQGMMALRGVAATLRLPFAARWIGAGIVVGLALYAGGRTAQRLVADVHYNGAYWIVQRQGGQPAEEAFAGFERALALWPRHVDARSDRAKLHYLRGEWGGVLEDTEAALRSLQAVKLWCWRAEALVRVGRREEALAAALNVVTRKDPLARRGPHMAQARNFVEQIALSPPSAFFRGM